MLYACFHTPHLAILDDELLAIDRPAMYKRQGSGWSGQHTLSQITCPAQ
jgi:hypothetical protein